MSQIFGPIHYKMWEKIKAKRRMTERIIAEAKKNRPDLVFEEENENLPAGDPATFIGPEDIHNDLAAYIRLVEHQMYGVLKKAAPAISKEKLTEMYEEQGVADGMADREDERPLIHKLMWRLLDGMPCDGGFEQLVEEQTPTFRFHTDVHAAYAGEHFDEELFHLMRDAYVKGYIRPYGKVLKSDQEYGGQPWYVLAEESSK